MKLPLACLALAGCVNGLEIPDNAVSLKGSDLLGSWPADCGAPFLARVSTEEFESLTISRLPSCSRQPMPYVMGPCVNGVTLATLDFAHKHSAIIFLDQAMHMNQAMERDVLAHEIRHARSVCESDDAQENHDGDVWKDDVYVNAVKTGIVPSTWERFQ